MALTFYWRCESGALDGTHDFSAGDTSGTATGSAAYSTSARLVGSSGNGLDIAAGGTVDFDVASILASGAGALGLWVQTTDFGLDSTRRFFEIWDSGSTPVLSLEANGAGSGSTDLNMFFNRGVPGVQLATSGAAMASGNKYFVLVAWDDTANSRYVGVYNSSLTLIDDTEDTSTNFDPIDSPSLIKMGNGGSWRGYIDNVFCGSTYADKDLILANADIESYTEWSTGGSIVPQAMANYRMRAA